jgi:hypothetical protein
MPQLRPLLVLLLPAFAAAASIFDTPELKVAPSPTQARQIHLAAGVRIVDTDVSPAGPIVALLLQNANNAQEIQFWNLNQAQAAKVWDVPAGLSARSLAFHPLGDSFFLAGTEAQQYVIVRVENKSGAWTSHKVYSSGQEIRRLVPGPRPYIVGSDEARHQDIRAYRLFFALKANDGHYSIRSITEDGKREYQTIGRKEGVAQDNDPEAGASQLTASSALPVGFHPAGHLMIWEDEKHCFQSAAYARDHWDKTTKLFGRDLCSGTVAATPNGAGIIHWASGKDGVDLLLQRGAVQTHEAAGYQLVSAPSSVPDGRGIVGVTKTDTGLTVNYIPINVPLADVVNAWMYLESGNDAQLLAKNGGLFRDLKKMDQLYMLYDSESYLCGGFDESTPTRPYFVTTDSFWELFSAAYEGIFIVRERQVAMPAFWQFVTKAYTSIRQAHPQSQWTGVFAALAAVSENKAAGNQEATRILNGTGPMASSLLKATFDYGELKPRGHYTSSEAVQHYFRAFRYLTRVSSLNLSTDELRALPPDVKSAALRWIGAYQDMIAPSRSPLLWQDKPTPAPQYAKHPMGAPVLFPLSWGFDNEILYSTIFHQELTGNERIDGPSGGRLTPSALDIAAALGSRFARGLLADEIVRYPKLDAMLTGLSTRAHAADTDARPNLYQRWVDALAVQWADSVASPNGQLDEKLWRAKRLQTGLASWATLRHATVLVNERVSAECGEGGFEAIVMRPPRGYVEPDPQTFGKIAELFDNTTKLIASTDMQLTGNLPPVDGSDGQANESLKQGILRRLSETAAKARYFQAMAAKEARGAPLTAQEYEDILYFGRVAEHHFLVFKSLANKDLALSTPKSMPKIADVADTGGGAPYLSVAVGRPLEWDHTVPYYGRREIVKGSAYSFYEFKSNSLLNDADWLKAVATQAHPAWVAPYVSPQVLSCPARNPF